MFTYTLGFIKKGTDILLINRHKKPWKGCWNGLGGKIEDGETPILSMIREIKEEAGIDVTIDQVQEKGYLTWNSFTADGQGLYLFLIHLDTHIEMDTPKNTLEGIIDFKPIDWIIDQDNYGVAHNIPYFLPTLLSDSKSYHYHCTFSDRILLSVSKEEIK